MLRELDDIGRETAVGAIRALEVELFGNHAWSEASIRQELDAPARVYVFDVDEADGRDTDREPAIRGFAGYWYDGDDAEIMDIGVSKTHQRQGIAVAMMNHLISRARRQGASEAHTSSMGTSRPAACCSSIHRATAVLTPEKLKSYGCAAPAFP